MFKTNIRILLWIAALSIFSGCATSKPAPIDTTDVKALQNLRSTRSAAQSADVAKIREDALQDTARGLGARGALAYRSAQINTVLAAKTKQLDTIFNFDGLVLENHVLPPVLTEGRSVLNVSDDQVLRLADRTYTILNQAKFVTRPPNWRDYLEMNFSKPDAPDKSLLPQNYNEQKFWQKSINEGWQHGIEQANLIFADRLATLSRDYTGMALYRKLLAENMVSRPYVAEANLGITGDSEHLRINDQVLRITALPSLQQNGNTWKPAVDDNQ